MIEKVSSVQFKFLGHLLIFALESEIKLIDYSGNVCFITNFITNNELFESSMYVSSRFGTMRHPAHKKLNTLPWVVILLKIHTRWYEIKACVTHCFCKMSIQSLHNVPKTTPTNKIPKGQRALMLICRSLLG